MQRLEVSGAVRPLYGSLGAKRLTSKKSVNTSLWIIILYKTAGGRQSVTCFDCSNGHLHTARTMKIFMLFSGTLFGYRELSLRYELTVLTLIRTNKFLILTRVATIKWHCFRKEGFVTQAVTLRSKDEALLSFVV